MKKIVKVFLILMLFTFNLNVFASNIKFIDNEEEVLNPIVSSDATLKEVYINSEKVVCDDKYVCEKVISDNSISSVSITYTKSNENASLSTEKIEEKIKTGVNEFKLEVVAEDGKTKIEYTFKITKKELSTDSSLKKLLINGEEITLKSGTLKYSTTVSYATTKLEIEAIPNDTNATFVDSKDNKIFYDFFDTKKEIKIKIKSEAGDLSTYSITVSKREEADTSLKTLKITNASIDFESGIYDYNITVLKNVENLEIKATPTDSKASVKIEQPDTLEIGENTIKIIVSNDGNTKTYTIKVNKLDEEDKNLANLESLKIDGYKLNFKEDTYEYNLEISDVNFLKIEAIPKYENAEVEITGNLDLVNGSIIKIKVIYDDETYNVYRINIIKNETEEENNNLLLYIIIIIIVLVIVLVIIIIIIIKKKNNKNKKDNKKNNKKNNKVNKNKKEQEKIISISTDEEIEDII